jgi:sugar/nucleoside kinase (ribokinase family)
MDPREATLKSLSQKASRANSLTALVGLDGFVDRIVKPVSQRFGPGGDFEPIPTIEAFGQRILSAVGKSTNIELHLEQEKLGGNGPIMAHAVLQAGVNTRYIGTLGDPNLHPVFEAFARRTQALSVAEPSVTHAAEFEDGKIMFGTMSSLQEVDYQRIIEKVGEGAFFDAVSRADLIALVNWTMMPHMTDIVSALHDRVLAHLGPRDQRFFFFDLADPAKRGEGDLVAFLRLIGKFRNHGTVVLGLNLKEAQQVAGCLGLGEIENEPESLRRGARAIRSELNLSVVAIHPVDCAACATRDDTFYSPGFYTSKPRITTGAGDHFNAGFMVSQMLQLPAPDSLLVGAAFSGFYARTGKSPSLGEIESFIRSTATATQS